jgi:hypothetical protein
MHLVRARRRRGHFSRSLDVDLWILLDEDHSALGQLSGRSGARGWLHPWLRLDWRLFPQFLIRELGTSFRRSPLRHGWSDVDGWSSLRLNRFQLRFRFMLGFGRLGGGILGGLVRLGAFIGIGE